MGFSLTPVAGGCMKSSFEIMHLICFIGGDFQSKV